MPCPEPLSAKIICNHTCGDNEKDERDIKYFTTCFILLSVHALPVTFVCFAANYSNSVGTSTVFAAAASIFYPLFSKIAGTQKLKFVSSSTTNFNDFNRPNFNFNFHVTFVSHTSTTSTSTSSFKHKTLDPWLPGYIYYEFQRVTLRTLFNHVPFHNSGWRLFDRVL